MKKHILFAFLFILFQILLCIQPSRGQDYVVSFDGMDDLIFINKYENLNVSSNDFTIEALVNLRQKQRDLHTILTNSSLSGGVFIGN